MNADANSRHTDALDELPISTSERMLGVEIKIHSQAMYCEMHGLRPRGGLSPDPEIRAVGGGSTSFDLVAGSRSRKYLAAWARRNLFNVDSREEER